MIWWIFLIWGWIVFFGWLKNYPSFFLFLRKGRLSLFANLSTSTVPMVSIIVPARNEEVKIEKCLTPLLELEYPAFEIIAINDRSTVQTGTIMDNLSKKDKRLTTIHIKELPEKWIGKNYAMHRGSQEAKGEFLLFTDELWILSTIHRNNSF
jgi:cellulose synthase/poly-beta-1,6-N-acetylglucosamine synthase-like glycosyltransferase